MIYFYSGTPGSGKSLHVAQDVWTSINLKHRNVIANFEMDRDKLYKNQNHGRFYYFKNQFMTVNNLVLYMQKFHKPKVEKQTLIVIDECQVIFNPREFDRKDRLDWIYFLCEHRKLGFNIILISQFDRLVDRQIRALFEYEEKHRKVNNYKIGRLLPFPAFACVEYWYGVREKLSTSFFIYRKKYGDLYDSFKRFSKGMLPSGGTGGGGARARAGGTSARPSGGTLIVR